MDRASFPIMEFECGDCEPGDGKFSSSRSGVTKKARRGHASYVLEDCEKPGFVNARPLREKGKCHIAKHLQPPKPTSPNFECRGARLGLIPRGDIGRLMAPRSGASYLCAPRNTTTETTHTAA